MEKVAGDFGAIGEAVGFLDHFADLPDPRQAGKVIYPLAEVLLLCLLAVLAGAETFVDIARFGEKKIKLLRRFRSFHNGTPSHDHLGDIFAALDAEQFQRCFVDWVAALTGTPRKVVAIDGKTAGIIAIADPIKATTPAAIKALKDAGIRQVAMVPDAGGWLCGSAWVWRGPRWGAAVGLGFMAPQLAQNGVDAGVSPEHRSAAAHVPDSLRRSVHGFRHRRDRGLGRERTVSRQAAPGAET